MNKLISRLMLAGLLMCIMNLPLAAQDNWSPQNSGTTSTLYGVQFLNDQTGFAVGDGGTVVKTTDGGLQWEDISIDTEFPVRDLDFVDAMQGWVATGDPDNSMTSGSVWHTTDGGSTWTPETIGTTQARFGVSFASDMIGWACGANNGAWDIRATTDGGESWNGQSGNGYGWLYDIHCISSTLGWAVGVAFFPSESGIIAHTTNGGTSWSGQDAGTIPFLFGVQFASADRGFVVGDSGTIMATTNGGGNWSPQESGTTANLRDVSFISDSVGWVCGLSGTILKTLDGGATWSPEESGVAFGLNGIHCLDSLTGWAVGVSGTILKMSAGTFIGDRNGSALPQEIVLHQNYPNPFNPTTRISFVLTKSSEVSLRVFDTIGRERARLIDHVTMGEGEHTVSFEGSALPSGLYFYCLDIGGTSETRKMVLLK